MSSEERISITKGSEIEVYSNEDGCSKAWYKAILEEAIPKSKRRKLLVRCLTPSKEGSSTPMYKRIDQTSIRPVPPRDLYGEVDFKEGDLVEAGYKEGWWNGRVVKVLQNARYRIYFELFLDVIEFERKNLRLRLDWIDGKWIRSENQQPSNSEFGTGMDVEVRDEIENLGEVWIPAIYINTNVNGKVYVKYNHRDTKSEVMEVYLHDIRSTPPPFEFREYELVEHVDALLDSGWCRGVVKQVLPENRYTVLIGEKQVSMDFNYLDLRPAGEWKDGVWQKEPKDAYDSKEILDTGKNPHAVEEKASSTRIRVTVVPPLLDNNAACVGKNSMVTRSSVGTIVGPLVAALPKGGDAVQVGQLFVASSTSVECTKKAMNLGETHIQSDIDPNKTAALSGELESKLANAVTNGDCLLTRPQEVATLKNRSSIVLGVAAALVKGSAVKTQGKTSPRKKLQVMRNQNQKGLENVSAGEKKVPAENQNRESVHKRKRGQPRKFIGIEPKQLSGVSTNSSKTATTDLGDMTDDQPLAAWIHSGNSSSGTSISRTPDPMLNSVVEKRVDVVETPVVSDSTMVLPFAKKSPVWKVIESMEAFKAVPQRPHFTPLLESKEEFREGSAIGAMVIFSGLIERLNNLQVDDPITSINSISESFTELEKHGFDVTVPQSRISKLLSMKRNQIGTMEELKVIDRKVTENEVKRRKCDEDFEEISRKIHELEREQMLIKEKQGKLEKERAQLQSNYRIVDGKLQIVDYEFQMTVAAPWK